MKLSRSATGRTRLRELGEDSLLNKLLPFMPGGPRVIAATGDDAAIVAGPGRGDLIVFKTDCVVEGIHFETRTAPEAVGWKAMMRTFSDFAAVSGVPEFALVTLIVRKEKEVSWVTRLYSGINQAARRFRVSVVGGETSAIRGPAAISISVIGRVEKHRWVSRRGGKPGDQIFVTGRLGGSIRGKHLRFVPRIEESRWLTANFRIHAMMDLSDGLGADLPRLARASNVGFHIDRDALPLTAGATADGAIADGEDYELLFAISSRDSLRLQTRWRKKFPRTRLTQIGALSPKSVPSRTGTLRNPQLKHGYVHFR
jgi:thiamine-monophosphate kinase